MTTRNRTILLLLAALMIVSCSRHQAGTGTAIERPHPKELEYSDLKVQTPDYTRIELSNGMKGFFIKDREIPVVNVSVMLKTFYPGKEKMGRNEMARWVMRNGGSENWPPDKLNDELEFLAARIEFYGGALSTTASLNCLKKDLPRVLEIYADLLMNPAFPEEKIDMKRKTMLEELRRKNDQPRNIARREYRKILYGGHPYGWEEKESTLNSITREDLVEFHQAYFHPGNTIIGISGDVTEPEIRKIMEENFSGWEKKEVETEKVPPVEVEEEGGIYYARKSDMNQAYIMMGHLGIKADNPDRCAMNIMNYILGGGSFASWITEEVRVKRGLAYSAGSYCNAGAFARGHFAAYAQTKAEEFARSIQLIEEQIKRMQNEGPTEKEFDKAVDSYLNSHVFDYESKEAIIRRLMRLEMEGRPLDTPERDMEKYSELTVAEIIRVANKYLDTGRLTTLIVGNKEKFGTPLSELGEVREIELEQ